MQTKRLLSTLAYHTIDEAVLFWDVDTDGIEYKARSLRGGESELPGSQIPPTVSGNFDVGVCWSMQLTLCVLVSSSTICRSFGARKHRQLEQHNFTDPW